MQPIPLGSVQPTTVNEPPIITAYSRPGVGKTTFGASFPDAIFLQTEKGQGSLTLSSFTPGGMIETYADAVACVVSLYNEPHNFKTLVIDTENHLEILMIQYVCAQNGWGSIESVNYGKGYVAVLEEYQRFFQWLELLNDQRHMNIILLAHAETTSAADPHLDEHKRLSLKMDKRTCAYTLEKSRAVFLLDRVVNIKGPEKNVLGSQAKAKDTGQRIMYTDGGGSFEAKNRFKGMPKTVIIPENGGYDAIKQYLPGQDILGMLKPNHPLAIQAAQQAATTAA